MNIIKVTAAVCSVAILSACASGSAEIQAANVSTMGYENQSCQSLNNEAHRLNAAIAQSSALQDKQASGDSTKMAVALVIFAPAALFIGGDKANAAELSRLKGEAIAVRETMSRKGC